MPESFDFTALLAEAEDRLDEELTPPHFGSEVVLAEGEDFRGRFRGEDLDKAFEPPRLVFLLVDPDGAPCFLRARTMLERRMREASPAVGDWIAVVRGQDGETRAGNPLQSWGVSSRPCSDPLPEFEFEDGGGDDGRSGQLNDDGPLPF